MTKHILNLPTLAGRIRMVDEFLVQLLASRHRLSLQVSASKRAGGEPVFRSEIERERIDAAAEYGAKLGLNPDFVRAIMYVVIGESCKDQIIERETYVGSPSNLLPYDEQKANLLALTKAIAKSYDVTYHSSHATRLYAAFEAAQLESLVFDMAHRDRFVDLGCGTGTVALGAGYKFESVVGYDLSPDMLEVARAKHAEKHANTNVAFVEADLENGIPEKDASVSFVAMTLGTASDLLNIGKVISEIRRVLKPGGRFMFSFYNSAALLYQWQYLPWQFSLAAHMNHDDHCLEVEHDGRAYQIYAHPYTTDEVGKMFEWATSKKTVTYPTIAAIMPNETFIGQPDDRLTRTMSELDTQLSFGHYGAYIIVSGEKS
ncbi:methyltransferase domain-containing protein [Candidatus Kaiserbacteria bacterium]|nr:methyltransferase domain-containing protein [Candidatus Kaiserbacteria bacterium]